MQLSHPKVENGFKHIPSTKFASSWQQHAQYLQIPLCFEFTHLKNNRTNPKTVSLSFLFPLEFLLAIFHKSLKIWKRNFVLVCMQSWRFD
jgi:hypothetical protein